MSRFDAYEHSVSAVQHPHLPYCLCDSVPYSALSRTANLSRRPVGPTARLLVGSFLKGDFPAPMRSVS